MASLLFAAYAVHPGHGKNLRRDGGGGGKGKSNDHDNDPNTYSSLHTDFTSSGASITSQTPSSSASSGPPVQNSTMAPSSAPSILNTHGSGTGSIITSMPQAPPTAHRNGISTAAKIGLSITLGLVLIGLAIILLFRARRRHRRRQPTEFVNTTVSPFTLITEVHGPRAKIRPPRVEAEPRDSDEKPVNLEDLRSIPALDAIHTTRPRHILQHPTSMQITSPAGFANSPTVLEAHLQAAREQLDTLAIRISDVEANLRSVGVMDISGEHPPEYV
ncbi:hypothetical protein MVEN_00727000 [Mycena venus]|uniref:Transmembrane protein n=1 Tax=Mycena venus TaxID=2733690 RepID=A0A8H7D5E8_9AGAR|nr:hypothetical protein MVEN_00727000 [Mycena venus]